MKGQNTCLIEIFVTVYRTVLLHKRHGLLVSSKNDFYTIFTKKKKLVTASLYIKLHWKRGLTNKKKNKKTELASRANILPKREANTFCQSCFPCKFIQPA